MSMTAMMTMYKVAEQAERYGLSERCLAREKELGFDIDTLIEKAAADHYEAVANLLFYTVKHASAIKAELAPYHKIYKEAFELRVGEMVKSGQYAPYNFDRFAQAGGYNPVPLMAGGVQAAQNAVAPETKRIMPDTSGLLEKIPAYKRFSEKHPILGAFAPMPLYAVPYLGSGLMGYDALSSLVNTFTPGISWKERFGNLGMAGLLGLGAAGGLIPGAGSVIAPAVSWAGRALGTGSKAVKGLQAAGKAIQPVGKQLKAMQAAGNAGKIGWGARMQGIFGNRAPQIQRIQAARGQRMAQAWQQAGPAARMMHAANKPLVLFPGAIAAGGLQTWGQMGREGQEAQGQQQQAQMQQAQQYYDPNLGMMRGPGTQGYFNRTPAGQNYSQGAYYQ